MQESYPFETPKGTQMDAHAEPGAAVDVMNVKRFNFSPEEIAQLTLSCQRLKQIRGAMVVNHRLIIEVDMGSLTGHMLVQAIEVLKSRVRQIVRNARPAPVLELVHSMS